MYLTVDDGAVRSIASPPVVLGAERVALYSTGRNRRPWCGTGTTAGVPGQAGRVGVHDPARRVLPVRCLCRWPIVVPVSMWWGEAACPVSGDSLVDQAGWVGHPGRRCRRIRCRAGRDRPAQSPRTGCRSSAVIVRLSWRTWQPPPRILAVIENLRAVGRDRLGVDLLPV